MDQILDSPEDVTPEFVYAGFWIRVAAYIIDYIVILILGGILGLILGSLIPGNPVAEVLLIFVAMMGYYCGMESSTTQATPGKMAVGIKVGDIDGDQLSFGHSLGRNLGKIVSGLILYIGFMMVGWDDMKQGLHDKMANTIVYYK